MTTEPDYVRLYETAESQVGSFTVNQARDHGFSWEHLSDHVKRGRFLRLFRGVFRQAHFPCSASEDLFVAWLRSGSNPVISHESALTLYNLSDVLPEEIHIVIPRTIADVAIDGLARELAVQSIRESVDRGLASREDFWRRQITRAVKPRELFTKR